jgi:hypothetical protein
MVGRDMQGTQIRTEKDWTEIQEDCLLEDREEVTKYMINKGNSKLTI